MDLSNLGFDSFFKEQYDLYKDEYELARVISVNRQIAILKTATSEVQGKLSGNFRYNNTRNAYPVIGDWVIFKYLDDSAIIEKILDRKSALKKDTTDRKRKDKVISKVIISNIDFVFTVMGLDNNYNIRRLERMVTMVWDSGATPVVVLTKVDLCQNFSEKLKEIEELSLGIDIISINSMTQDGYQKFDSYLKPGKTICLLGSSGAGKSTITNNLLGHDVQATKDVRVKDSKGQHTTTSRDLFFLKTQAMIIDTPGMREFGVSSVDDGAIDSTFSDIVEMEQQCKFNDCQHITEPGCAIIEAVENKDIPVERYQSFLKLKKEQMYSENKENYLNLKEKFFKEVRKNYKKANKRKE